MKYHLKLSLCVVTAWITFLAPGNAWTAEEGPLSTDRPDFVEASITVGKGRVQIETSVAFEEMRENDFKAEVWATPTLLRIGFAENWEARFETDGRMAVKFTDRDLDVSMTERGWADLSVGVKWHTYDGEPGTVKPSVGWLLHADLASGSDEFRGRGTRPSLRVVGEWELPHDNALGVMPGAVYESDETGDRYWIALFGIVGAHSFTDQFRVFVELAIPQIASESRGGDVVHYVAGAAYLINNNWQLDTAASWGGTRYTPDFGWTMGLSARF